MHRAGRQARRFLSAILKNENGDLVLADLVDQLRPGRLRQISDAPAEQRELRALQSGRLKPKGILP